MLFVVDQYSVGWLKFYVWNPTTVAWDYKTRIQVDAAVASNWQRKTSLIRTIDGVIFKAADESTITHYLTLDYSWTATTLTIDTASFGSYLGTVSYSSLKLLQ